MLNGFGLTQQKMLACLLKNKKGMTIDEFVKTLEITRTAVNQHISVLEKNGYVKKHALTKTGGRPGQIFVLSEQGIHLFPKSYAWFSELLIQKLKELYGSGELEKLLSELAVSVASTLESRFGRATEDERLAILVEIMQELGYESSLDIQEGDQIRASNCVYHELAVNNKEVCAFDLALISNLTGRQVEQKECMVRDGSQCCFKLGAKLVEEKAFEFKALVKEEMNG